MDQLGDRRDPVNHGPAYAAPARPTPTSHGARPEGALRPYDAASRPSTGTRPPSQSTDHRYARPSPQSVRPAPGAYYGVPNRYSYRPYYTRWYVHPWYRYTYSTTVVVGFGFPCYAWNTGWAPPYRSGWMWSYGAWQGSVWWPGYWTPVGTVMSGYAWVPGWWNNSIYIDGYYRPQQRTDGAWTWVDGYYLQDGSYVRGYWAPTQNGPEGYTWEPGFWDGQQWVEGFWRPQFRSSFTWVSSYYDEDSTYHAGYWAPTQANPGHVWIPGWFDGNTWVEGYWVDDQQYQNTDISQWQAPEGWNDGWSNSDPSRAAPPPPAGAALGIPVDP